jgi:hypothetical protein
MQSIKVFSKPPERALGQLLSSDDDVASSPRPDCGHFAKRPSRPCRLPALKPVSGPMFSLDFRLLLVETGTAAFGRSGQVSGRSFRPECKRMATQIEVTPALIEAGAHVLELYDLRRAVPGDRLPAEVFQAMLLADQ